MNEIEKIDYIHNVIKETLWAIENDISNAPIGMLENSLDLTAIKEKINSGQF